jgi:HEAT repeat protein
MKLLGTEDQTLRHAARRALAAVGRPAVVELIGRLGDPEPTVRVDAALALGAIRDRRSIPRLEQRLSDPASPVRSAVALALAGYGDDALPTLVRVLLGGDEVAVATALDALVQVGGAAVPWLTQLTTAGPPGGDRACEALRRIGTLPALLHLSEIGRRHSVT